MCAAILLSSNRYDYYPHLSYCHRDGELMAETLAQWCDYAGACRINHIMLDREDRLCTPAALLAALRTLDAEERARWTSWDSFDQHSLLFYFAGHGLFDEVTQTSYLLLPASDPEDLTGTALSIRSLRSTLAALNRPIVQIYDACHSGVRSERPESRGFINDLRHNIERSGEGTRGRHPGWEMLAACDEDEASHEDPELQHGLFTYALGEAIRQAPAGSELPLAQLKDGICQQVSALAERRGYVQNPVFAARTYGRQVFARRNSHTPPARSHADSRVDSDSGALRHAINLPACVSSETDLTHLLGPCAVRGRRISLRVTRERDKVHYEVLANPQFIRAGRRVARPSFCVTPNHFIQEGPYDWQDQRIRLRLDTQRAILDAVDIDGRKIVVSLAVA